MRRQLRFRWAMVVGMGLLLCWGASAGRYYATSICPQCGLVRLTAQWQIPMIWMATLYSTHADHSSALSLALEECELQHAHDHKWILAHGNGNGIMCALGRGGHIYTADNARCVADLVRAAHHCGEKTLLDNLLMILADPKKCQLVEDLAAEAYAEDLSEASHFRAWLEQHQDEVKAIREAAATSL